MSEKALTAGIPNNYEISHKFGERQYLSTGEKQLHDCGIIYIPKKPYLLCVMTRGKNFDDLANTIKLISKTVFTQITQE